MEIMEEKKREIGHLTETTTDGKRVYKFENGSRLDTSQLRILSITRHEIIYEVGDRTGKRLSCPVDGEEAVLYTL